MLRLKKILCPTDFSEYSGRALKYARKLAGSFKARLYVQHVIEDLVVMAPDIYASLSDFQSLRATYRQEIIERLQEGRTADEEAITVVSQGSPSLEILKAAQQQEVDLIVMGTHGRQGLGRLVIGSVAEEVVKKANCPVLTVGHFAYEPSGPLDFRRVLVAVDFSDYSRAALAYALSWAQNFQSELYLLHVVERPLASTGPQPISETEALEQSLAAAQERLTRMIPEPISRHYKVQAIAKAGHPHREIVTAARQIDADVVVMGVVGHGALSSVLFGSTTYRVIKEVPCPVLTVRGWKRAAKD